MVDNWDDNYQEQLKRLGITCLYHITDKDNLVSIFTDGYLSSWGKTLEDGIRVSNPGGDAVSHRLDARFSPDRRSFVHLYAMEPSDSQLQEFTISQNIGDAYVLKISTKAIRPGNTVFWIGDPYDGGERIDNVSDLDERLRDNPELLGSVTVDIINSIRYNFILNAPNELTSKISKLHPTAIVFVIDQSCSMARGTDVDQVEYDYISELAAITVNEQIDRFLKRCLTEDGTVQHLYDIAVIGYGDGVYTAWNGELASSDFHSPEELFAHLQEDGDMYRWVDAKDSDTRGRCDLAFEHVYELLNSWIQKEENRFSYPPTVIHISDGDVKREYQRLFLINAEKIKRLRTESGDVILWNIGILPFRYNEFVFISGEELPALMQFSGSLVLYEASSYLPTRFKEKAASIHGHDPHLARKTMGVNVRAKTLSEILQLCVLPE